LRSVKRAAPATRGAIDLRLPVRTPFDGAALLTFLAGRAITGVERVDGHSYARTLRLPHGTGTVVLTMPEPAANPAGGRTFVSATLTVDHIQDLAPAVARCRRLLDADADPQGIAGALSADPALADAVAGSPGLRLPGAVDGPEIVMRALMGQQVSVAAARTALGKLTAAAGEPIDSPVPGLTHLFPAPADIAALGPERIGGPRRRAAAISAAAEDLADGRLVVDAGRQTADLTADLVMRAGIGPWTAGYIAMRVLGDPDVLLTGDLALRHGAAALGLPAAPRDLAAHAERWRPFRSYAGMYLWRSCPPPARPAARRPAAAPAGITAKDPHPEGPDLI
jgi:AraC family transcriptional regulator of adaptative response / DNA-3-methyladenine glycosylase II